MSCEAAGARDRWTRSADAVGGPETAVLGASAVAVESGTAGPLHPICGGGSCFWLGDAEATLSEARSGIGERFPAALVHGKRRTPANREEQSDFADCLHLRNRGATGGAGGNCDSVGYPQS